MSRPKILQDLLFDPETNDIYRIIVGTEENNPHVGTTTYEKMMIVKCQREIPMYEKHKDIDNVSVRLPEFIYKLKPCTDETLI